MRNYYTTIIVGCAVFSGCFAQSSSIPFTDEQVKACIMPQFTPLTDSLRMRFADCLGFKKKHTINSCHGYYQNFSYPILTDNAYHILADQTVLNEDGESILKGHVSVQKNTQIVTAQTAKIIRDARSKKIKSIKLNQVVRYQEPGRMLIAEQANMFMDNNEAFLNKLLYRFDSNKAHAVLPAWGRARKAHRQSNKNIVLYNASYTTCPPEDKSWEIKAQKITIDEAQKKAIVRHGYLTVNDTPILYTPYLSLPTSNERKSGFLFPLGGYSNISGYDLGLPYYWNMAPNYDAIITPHVFSKRGVMLGAKFRYLLNHSSGFISGNYLPNDKAFNSFIQSEENAFPGFSKQSNNRWDILIGDRSQLSENMVFSLNYEQVSDDYYLQDFSNNLSISSQNQLLREGRIKYHGTYLDFQGLIQSYQTLHPINQSEVSDIYERLPSLSAYSDFSDTPNPIKLKLLSQFDYFNWPNRQPYKPVGPRMFINPISYISFDNTWGYIKPELQGVGRIYDVTYNQTGMHNQMARFLPRVSIDSGLFLERQTHFNQQTYTQTLEPRLYYLYVPFQSQQAIPNYDSSYMIFNYDQLFRTNRFSGFDRMGDANQIAYAVKSRLINKKTGIEKASFSIGQLYYFSQRKVQLCYDYFGQCEDSTKVLGYLSPTSIRSPLTARAFIYANKNWSLGTDVSWGLHEDTLSTVNANINYQGADNRLLRFEYSYLTNGDITQLPRTSVQDNALNQVMTSYAWPINEKLSSMGIFSYNISKRYSMIEYVGLQYDTCCWAVRLMGGRSFNSIEPQTHLPRYNNNVYVQILLKGLGSMASSNPASIFASYLPKYHDIFNV